MDDTQDKQDGRWLTYAELAAIRGIGRASAVKLVQRERWRRSSGNDRARTVRVLVPPDWLAPAKERPASSDAPAMSGEYSGMLAGALAALESAVFSLTARAEGAEQGRGAALALAERTLAQLAEVSARAERAEDATEAQRRRVTVLQHDLDTANAEAAAARERAEALQREDDARKARGLLARLRAAVRGE